MYRILLAENEELFVNGFWEVLSNLPEASICKIMQNVDNLAEVCQTLKPDLVLTRSFYYHQKTAFEAIKELKQACPNIKVMMMLDINKFAHMEMAYKAGADACIDRGESAINYIAIIYKIMHGMPIDMPLQDDNAWGPNRAKLSKRDKEVVLCLCQNMSKDEIAEELGLKFEQVEATISRILAKTKHKNTLGLIFEAIHKGYSYKWRTDNG